MSPSPVDVMRLGLRGNAAEALRLLVAAHPDVEIKDGRRSRREQAEAMAGNIVADDRDWIAATYKPSKASKLCQAWVNEHHEAVAKAQLADGIMSVFDALTDDELSHLSKHLSGDAFDVKPVRGYWGQLILQTLRRIVAELGGKLLEEEGDLTRWHAQF